MSTRVFYPPEAWIRRKNSSYKSVWGLFEAWTKSKHGLDWKALLEKAGNEIRDFIDEYLEEKKGQHTSKSIRCMNSTLRSYFSFNDVVVPRTRLSLVGGRSMMLPKLNVRYLREIINTTKPRDKSFLLFKFQSLQDNKRMLWINRKAWPQIKSQLDAGGHVDRNGVLWKDVIRIELPIERKGNPQPYFCLVGKEAIDTLKKHISMAGEPTDVIWKGLNSEASMVAMMTRLGVRAGLIPSVRNGDKGARFGLSLHEMRDVCRSLWHESGADLSVAEFMMGHAIDKLGYDKIMTLSPDYAVKAFKQAEPFLSITELGKQITEVQKSQAEELERLKTDLQTQTEEMQQFHSQIIRRDEEVQKLTDKLIESTKRLEELEKRLTEKHP